MAGPDDRTTTDLFEQRAVTKPLERERRRDTLTSSQYRTMSSGGYRTMTSGAYRTATSGSLPMGGGRTHSAVSLEVHGGHKTDRRRFSRYDARLKVRMVTRERETIFFTRSVGSSGMFIHTDRPARGNQLLRLRVAIPEVEGELKMLALVRWRRTKQEAQASGLPEGMGVAFYQVPDSAKRIWGELIRTFEDRLQFAPFEEAEVRIETGPLKVAHQRRRQSRLRRSLTVSWTVQGRIYQNITDDVSPGGFFIPKVQSLMPGTRLEFTLFSTANLDAFRVLAEILRIENGQQGRHGSAVRIRQLLDGDGAAFDRFITPDAPDLGTSDDLVIEDNGPFHVPGPAERMAPEPEPPSGIHAAPIPPEPILEGRRPSDPGAVFEGFEPRTPTTKMTKPSPAREPGTLDTQDMDLMDFIKAGSG